jgi:hypothetical protein
LFEREHHRQIACVLDALNAQLLADHGCYFGGGTAMALRYGEYRKSVDIDFLVSRIEGYRALRQLLTGSLAFQAIARPGAELKTLREVRADQYGIRTIVQVAQSPIKFEIVLEGRIALEPPTADDVICGIATLTPLDMATSKLLANSDRWADDSVFSRDLIDLAMMQPGKGLLLQAIAKSQKAYGNSIEADLAKAIDRLLNRQGRLERCMQMMQITVPKALLWKRIKALVPKPSNTTVQT